MNTLTVLLLVFLLFFHSSEAGDMICTKIHCDQKPCKKDSCKKYCAESYKRGWGECIKRKNDPKCCQCAWACG